MSDVADLPDDIDALKAIVRGMSAQVAARDAEIARHQAQLRHHALMIAKLKARLSKQLRDRFGSSAESLEQLQLMLEDLEISHSAETPVSEPVPGPAQKDKPVRKPLPDHLPRAEQVLEPGNACGECGGKLKRVGEDVTEELE
jgi:transposase